MLARKLISTSDEFLFRNKKHTTEIIGLFDSSFLQVQLMCFFEELLSLRSSFF